MMNIVVINPNSTHSITEAIKSTLSSWRAPAFPSFECLTLHEAPAAIDTRADIRSAAKLVLATVDSLDEHAIVVIACFSDPGLALIRRRRVLRVAFGIGECSMLAAGAIGRRFGILSTSPRSVTRHRRYAQTLGLASRIAADVPTGIGVLGFHDPGSLDKLTMLGRDLRDNWGADVLILGCAGMIHHRRSLEDRLRIPIIDPVHAAFGFAYERAKVTDAAAHQRVTSRENATAVIAS